jgi:hypothetical protein
MHRVVRRGGTVAACMWDRQRMDMLAAVNRTQQAFPSNSETTEARTLYRTREEIERLFPAPVFADVASELLEVEAEYRDFDEFWGALADGAGPAGTWVKALDDDTRAAARAELERQVGSPSGEFTLRGRAWAVRATRV